MVVEDITVLPESFGIFFVQDCSLTDCLVCAGQPFIEESTKACRMF